jgi:hypothetical protein
MNSTETGGRRLTAVCLALAGALTAASIVAQAGATAGPLPAPKDTATTVAVLTFAYAQLPLAVGMVGVARLIGTRAKVLGILTAVFGVLGVFGQTVGAGRMLLVQRMAADPEHADVYTGLLMQEPGPVDGPFRLLGLLGTVLGLVLLSAGLLKGRVGPRWIPVVLLAFVVVQFIGSNITVWAGPTSAALFLLAFAALAVVVWRTPAPESVPTDPSASGGRRAATSGKLD